MKSNSCTFDLFTTPDAQKSAWGRPVRVDGGNMVTIITKRQQGPDVMKPSMGIEDRMCR